MKRTIVVFGVLVAFLCATFGAYAVENNTWGKVKASFVKGSEKAADDPQVLPDSEAPRVAKSAKTEKGKEDPAPTKKEKKDSSSTTEEDSPTYTKKVGPSRYAKAPR